MRITLVVTENISESKGSAKSTGRRRYWDALMPERPVSKAVAHSRYPGGFYYPLGYVIPLPDTFSGPKFSRHKCTRCAESGMICDVPDRGLEPCKQCFDDGAVCSLPFLYVFGIGSLKYAANSTNGLP